MSVHHMCAVPAEGSGSPRTAVTDGCAVLWVLRKSISALNPATSLAPPPNFSRQGLWLIVELSDCARLAGQVFRKTILSSAPQCWDYGPTQFLTSGMELGCLCLFGEQCTDHLRNFPCSPSLILIEHSEGASLALAGSNQEDDSSI